MDNITLQRIATLHPKIRQKVLDAYIHINNRLLGKGVRLRFTHTTRTNQEQDELYAQGRTVPGDIVTWTLNSRHLPASDGFGKAVDLVPYPINWNETRKFDDIAKAMIQASKELNIEIRWGADWDMDGIPRERDEIDSPHFELV